MTDLDQQIAEMLHEHAMQVISGKPASPPLNERIKAAILAENERCAAIAASFGDFIVASAILDPFDDSDEDRSQSDQMEVEAK